MRPSVLTCESTAVFESPLGPWRHRYQEQQVQADKRTNPRVTKSELVLWRALQQRSDSPWERERPSGPYTLDFFNEQGQLAVEVDGGSHRHRAEHDARRDDYHERRGVRTARFTDGEVLSDLDFVLRTIDELLRKRLEWTASRGQQLPDEPPTTDEPLVSEEGYDERTVGLASEAAILHGIPAARTVLPEPGAQGWRSALVDRGRRAISW
ncbi:MAG: hypothetical protein NVSMB13_14970 [Mycobacteriales bacterium]